MDPLFTQCFINFLNTYIKMASLLEHELVMHTYFRDLSQLTPRKNMHPIGISNKILSLS